MHDRKGRAPITRETLAPVRTKIIFNGTEYDDLEAMPQDVRQLYEKMLRAAETGDVPADIITEGEIKDILEGPKNSGNINPGIGNMGTPTKAESAFSSRSLILGVMAIALIILLYYMFKLNGKRLETLFRTTAFRCPWVLKTETKA